MNYLAHILLSGDNTEVQLGNFIGDAVKGNDYLTYKPDILIGLLLHRQIDSFTDMHPVVHRSKKRLNSRYGHYSGVIIDIFYDYFLSRNWNLFCPVKLPVFIREFYTLIESRYSELPPEIQQITPKLIQNDWFGKYQTIEGISKVLLGMQKKIKHHVPLALSIEDLQSKQAFFEEDFLLFFPELIKHVHKSIQILNKQYHEP